MASAAETTTAQSAAHQKTRCWNPDKNHGRYAAEDYSGCEFIEIKHPTLKAGDFCTQCQYGHRRARLTHEDAGIFIRLSGNPLITGKTYSVEKLYCTLCGATYPAPVPAEIAQQAKYDASCYSALAINHYYLGMPFKRIETWQAMAGIPLADATQWDLMRSLYTRVAPVTQCLEREAAQGELILYDDTPQRILENLKNVASGKSSRKKCYTTVMISCTKGKEISLFRTSERYAGENLAVLLAQRTTTEPLISMSDASSMNFPSEIEEDLRARWILCFCLAHGRRKFFDIHDAFTEECDFVLEQIGAVYYHEKIAKERKYNAIERLAYHQKHSLPRMMALRTWLNNKLLFAEAEANSSLGEAIRYLLKHWDALTRFLWIAGLPIDNSLSERTIKIMIRYRKNSYFFKTSFGAEVGDALMSLTHTAMRHQISVFEYLNALQHYHERVARAPEKWLPWNYIESIREITQMAQAA